MPNKRQIEANKYYVGSDSVFTRINRVDGKVGWGHPTLEAATEQAIEMARETERDVTIVKVIRVVRPSKPPIDVEDVE